MVSYIKTIARRICGGQRDIFFVDGYIKIFEYDLNLLKTYALYCAYVFSLWSIKAFDESVGLFDVGHIKYRLALGAAIGFCRGGYFYQRVTVAAAVHFLFKLFNRIMRGYC